ncbi:MAG: hypothetical protein IKV27_00565 [Lachnospiraceae bacterium]|nr:hypothetical protein [Lachnospiraceae bacterium]
MLKAGVGRVVITPPLGTLLYGYAPPRPAEAVGDDLHVIAAALEYGDTTVLILSADVCTCPPKLADEIRTAISEKTGVPYGNILYNTSHTHSGPIISFQSSGWGSGNMDFMYNTMLPSSVKAAVMAMESLRPALFGVGTTESEVAVNRRSISPNGEVGLGQCPWGLMDREMTVLSFKDAENGEIILNMIHYSAHATASGPNPEITRDWPGPMKDILERESGGITMFIAGSNGETGPRCPNGETLQSYEAALELGKIAGHDAVRAWRKIKNWQEAPVTVVNGDVTVPYDALPPMEEVLAEKERLVSEEYLRSQNRLEEINEWNRVVGILAEYESGHIKTHYVFGQSIVAVGPVAIVPFQYEMFMEMTLRLRHYSPFSYTLCLSNTNGSLSYLPSRDQLCLGGYEVWQFRSKTYKLVDNADDYMVTENLKLLVEAYRTQS